MLIMIMPQRNAHTILTVFLCFLLNNMYVFLKLTFVLYTIEVKLHTV
jgi:hypothetical protein